MDKHPGSVPKMIEIQAERSGGTTGLTPRWLSAIAPPRVEWFWMSKIRCLKPDN